MNLVVVTKFFDIICDAIFISLFNAGQTAGKLYGPISNYFVIVKINGCGMLYLHCLVWFKSISYLATLQF